MTHVAWRHQLFLVPNHLCDPVGREARSGRRLLLSLPPSVLPLQASGSLGNSSTIEGYFYLHRQQKGADCNKNGHSWVEAPSVEVKMKHHGGCCTQCRSVMISWAAVSYFLLYYYFSVANDIQFLLCIVSQQFKRLIVQTKGPETLPRNFFPSNSPSSVLRAFYCRRHGW
jgi:hypothetical protein